MVRTMEEKLRIARNRAERGGWFIFVGLLAFATTGVCTAADFFIERGQQFWTLELAGLVASVGFGAIGVQQLRSSIVVED